MLRLGFLPHGVTGPLSRTPYPTKKQKSKRTTTPTQNPRVGTGRASHSLPRESVARRRWGVRVKGLSLSARVEITKKYAHSYASAPKKGKSQILDQRNKCQSTAIWESMYPGKTRAADQP